jgi:hypothetical protein
MDVGLVNGSAVFVVMQMMIRTALTAVLTANHTASNIVNANSAKMKHYENDIAFRHASRDRFKR